MTQGFPGQCRVKSVGQRREWARGEHGLENSVGQRSVGINSCAVGRSAQSRPSPGQDKTALCCPKSFSTKVETGRFAPQRRSLLPRHSLAHVSVAHDLLWPTLSSGPRSLLPDSSPGTDPRKSSVTLVKAALPLYPQILCYNTLITYLANATRFPLFRSTANQ